MMTEREFRRIALALEGATESAHMGHPDFRAHGRIFATLHHDRTSAMVVLTPAQQRRFMGTSTAFTPEAGAWGRGGSTRVDLRAADEEAVGEALTLAWRNAEAKSTAKNAAPRAVKRTVARKVSR
jgi:hypothetical protein